MNKNSDIPSQPWYSPAVLWQRKSTVIAALSIAGIFTFLVLRYGLLAEPGIYQIPLLVTLVLGGLPMLYDLLRKLLKREFGSDLLGGISIITSVLLGEYLAGSIIVLMLAGGEALESYALRSASSVLAALAKRMPSVAHRKNGTDMRDVTLADIAVGDVLVIYPHEICPADGVVTEGHGVMDESYLTGEPFQITKTTGSNLISGAINGESALTYRTTKVAADSRYAKIMEVMRESESKRPQLQRLGDQLGAIYTPVALVVAIAAWVLSGESVRFLAVLVIATPCPLLLAIPIAIIGSISLCARRAIIVKSPVVLEQIAGCRTAIFDKTGTLTYGEPKLTEQLIAPGFDQNEVLTLVASLERYSKHPLARAILATAKGAGIQLPQATEVGEAPGQGLRGKVSGHQLQITSRNKLVAEKVAGADQLPPLAGGLECVVVIDQHYAAALRFRDAPRAENRMVMAPLTRMRAGPGRVPTPLMAEYYAQRAAAGLIVNEATAISQQGTGCPNSPGIYTDEQIAGWQNVTEAVHHAGGRIFLQLWHMGRISHPSFQVDGGLPVAPSAIAPRTGQVLTERGMQPYVTPRALDKEELPGIVMQYALAAEHAKTAGFDGVEIHNANGYLLDQFLRDGTNQRTDEYGGPVRNRARLTLEVTDAVTQVWGADRVGIRFSPGGVFNDMEDSNPLETFSHVLHELNRFKLAYAHLIVSTKDDLKHGAVPVPLAALRKEFHGPLIVANGFTYETATHALADGLADAVAFGRLFIANPDLPARFRLDAPLNPLDEEKLYGGARKGYTDYPAMGTQLVEK